MTAFDIIIVAIIIISTLVGAGRGVIKEAIALSAWAISIWCAFKFANPAGVMIQNLKLGDALNEPTTRHVAGFVAVLIVAFLAVTIFGQFLGNLVRAIGLTPLDRVAGLGFGFVRGALIVAVAVTLISLTPMANSDAWNNSKLVPPAKLVTQAVIDKFSPEISQFFHQ